MSTIWIKNNIRTEGKVLKVGDQMIFNPTEKQLRAAGYIPEEEVLPPQKKLSEKEQKEQELERLREQVEQECSNYFNDTVLKYFVGDSFDWISIEDRVKFSYTLECISNQIEEIQYKGKNYKVQDVLDMLKKITLYEYLCREVLKKHLKAIRSSVSPESIDYTEGYPERLIFE